MQSENTRICKICGKERPLEKFKKEGGKCYPDRRSKMCNSCRYFKNKPFKKKYPCDDQRYVNKRIISYRYHAKERNLEWSITKEQFDNITKKQCYYCGGFNKYKGTQFDYCGIDRKDNTRGYVLDNIIPCCGDCNHAKSDLTYEQFLMMAESIYNRLIKRKSTASKLDSAPTAYSFDDFMLVPVHSKIKSRRDPDVSVNLPGFSYKIPIVSSPMNTVTEIEMLVTMAAAGGLGVLHRYMSIEDQVKMCKEALARLSDAEEALSDAGAAGTTSPAIYAAVGAHADDLERVAVLAEAGVTGVCVDVANGHNELCLLAVADIKKRWPTVKVMAGNVCTYDGARDLALSGADSIRIGIGPGANCTTRMVTGHGVPQLTAIEDCASLKTEFPNIALIADGGLRAPGDIVKALAIGADCVMIGSLLAGTMESPGDWLEEEGRLFKYYHGMASDQARKSWFDKSKAGLPSEGVSTKVPYLGKSAAKVIEGICQSVKVGLSYSGAQSIKELQKNAKWCKITIAGYKESTPHGKK